MSKKKRNKKRSKKYKRPNNNTHIRPVLLQKAKAWLTWLAGIGLLGFAVTYFNDFLNKDIEIHYLKQVGRGYEFKITNHRPTDQMIEYFRVAPDFNQKPVFKIVDNVYGLISEDGVSIPGGNETYVPAYEYNELDGYLLRAKSNVTIQVPPIVARDYMAPEAVIVDIEYKTKPSHSLAGKLEKLFGLSDEDKKKRYLVSQSYWTPLSENNSTNSLEVACRDTEWFSKTEMCREQNKVNNL